MKIIRNILIISIILLLAWFVTSPYMEVGHIVLVGEGNEYGDDFYQEILKKNWLLTSEEQFLDFILQNKLIKTATVYKSGFLELSMDLVWRKPFVAIRSGGKYVIVDQEGIVLKVLNTADAPYKINGFSVVSSKVGNYIDTKDSHLIESAVKFVYLFEKYSESGTNLALSPKIELINGELIQRINDKFCINFGDGYDPEEQFSDAISIYVDMHSKRINSGVINLSNKNQKIYEPWKEQF